MRDKTGLFAAAFSAAAALCAGGAAVCAAAGAGNAPLIVFAVCAAAFAALAAAFYFLSLRGPLGADGRALAALRQLADGSYAQHKYKKSEETGRLAQQVVDTLGRLRLERGRVLSMLDNVSEGLVVLDGGLGITLINKSAQSFFNVDSSVKGRNLLRLVHMPRMIDAAQSAVSDGLHSSFDIISPDGERVLQAIISPAMTDEDKPGGAIILITDVTAVRRAEKIRSDFVANASHELKTPLTSIKGFTELMESGIIDDPEQSSRCLENIRKETERMIGLINDILKLSELESGVSDTGLSQVSLKMIAQRAAESLDIQAHGKNVSVEVTGGTGMMKANPDRITEVALNLIDNAIKYNRPGGSVKVNISESDGEVALEVADTGVGIPPESQERVFERFYRVDKSRSRKQGGTGLGLSIVKHITELYKGRLELSSTPGAGTTIKVTFPTE
jgi:two-component system phosphate regulon sensor histidine kinase PhoR